MFLKVKLLTGLGWKASQQIVRKGLQEDLQWLFDPTWHWHEATTSFHWRGHRGDPAKNCSFETQMLAEQRYADQGWKEWVFWKLGCNASQKKTIRGDEKAQLLSRRDMSSSIIILNICNCYISASSPPQWSIKRPRWLLPSRRGCPREHRPCAILLCNSVLFVVFY